MTAKKKFTKKGSTKGKAEGKTTKRLQTRDEREQQLVDETLAHAGEIRRERAESNLRAALASPEATEEQKAEARRTLARLTYAQTAYRRALAHFDATKGKPNRFTRSLLVIDYDRDDPEAVALAVRVPGSFADDSQLEAETFLKWREDAEFIARVLEHRDCPDSLRQAVGVIYTDLMNESKVAWLTPDVMRLQLPLVLLDYYRRGMPAEADNTRQILVSLCQEMGEEAAHEAVKSFTNED